MANDPAQPKFQLNGTQMLALHMIEACQNAINYSGSACAAPTCGEKDAAELLGVCQRELEAAKLRWLNETQRAVRVVSAIPDKLNGAGLVRG